MLYKSVMPNNMASTTTATVITSIKVEATWDADNRVNPQAADTPPISCSSSRPVSPDCRFLPSLSALGVMDRTNQARMITALRAVLIPLNVLMSLDFACAGKRCTDNDKSYYDDEKLKSAINQAGDDKSSRWWYFKQKQWYFKKDNDKSSKDQMMINHTNNEKWKTMMNQTQMINKRW